MTTVSGSLQATYYGDESDALVPRTFDDDADGHYNGKHRRPTTRAVDGTTMDLYTGGTPWQQCKYWMRDKYDFAAEVC